MTGRAVVLARGLGTRMRTADPGAALSDAQRHAADAGHKALMPIGERAFLDYVLSSLADAGIRQVALVVAPEHAALVRHLAAHPPSRMDIALVVQAEPIGTANAILSAQSWTSGEPFLAMNSDNLYPVDALRAVAALDEPGLPVFDAADLVATSNIPPERIASFAVLDVDHDGYLASIVEKPDPLTTGHRPSAIGHRISMNCWRFDARIFQACGDVPRSVRGEYELPEAVGLAIARGMRIRAVPAAGPVLDLSRRADAIDVARRLAGVVPQP